MANKEPSWVEVAGHADELLQLILDSTPKEAFELPAAYPRILAMFWRARRLYEGVLLLLKAGLLEESAILARSLFEESLRLRQLAAEEAHRDALIMKWANRSIDQKLGLLEVGKSCGLSQDIDAESASLEEQRRAVQEYATRHGVGRYKSFLSVKDAAFKFDRREDYWTYEWSHESVHGGDAAWMFSARRLAKDTVGFLAKNDDPELLSAFAQFAAKSMTESAAAAFSIFGWTMPSAAMQTLNEIERALGSSSAS